MAQTTSQPASLRLFVDANRVPKPSPAPVASLPEVLKAFGRATGWTLDYQTLQNQAGRKTAAPKAAWSASISTAAGDRLGQLSLRQADRSQESLEELAQDKPATIDLTSARPLASAISGMLEELLQTRTALTEREAELAVGVPLMQHPQEKQHLAGRLEAVLRGGAEAVGCQAAGLYLLDEATSKLKLRSCWGLPLDRLTAPARPLKGAVADLESLLGHAVVLQDTALMPSWNTPEDFPAAVCVPVSTSTTILGTLWLFSTSKRDFSDSETNIVELVAGRVAAELDREMLWQEGASAAAIKKEISAAERMQRSQLPSLAPLLDGWDLSGWTEQAGPLGGDFHDWFSLPDGLLAVAVGHAMEQGVTAALVASSLKSALRAHGPYFRESQQTIKRLNLTMWTGSAGDQHASLLYALVETATGRVCAASAGRVAAVLMRRSHWERLSFASAQLGAGPETEYEQFGYEMQTGDVLVMATEGVFGTQHGGGVRGCEVEIAQTLYGKLNRPAGELATALRNFWCDPARGLLGRDRTALVLKRR